MWTPEDREQIEELREVIEKRPEQIFELASDENFELGKSDGLYQKLSMAIANIKNLAPEVVVSPDHPEEYIGYFCIGGYGIHTFILEPHKDYKNQVKDYFNTEIVVPESIWGPVLDRAHFTERSW